MFDSFFKIAYFNLWRRKSRSILVIIMIAFGLMSMIFSQGLYEGMMVQMMSDTIRTGTGEITISKKGYHKSKLLSHYIQDLNPVEHVLKETPQVMDFASRLKCEGVIASAKYTQGVIIYGVDLQEEENFINYKKPIRKGTFSFNSSKNAVIIGELLAERLKVTIGKKIILQGQALDKEIASIGARITGIIRTNNPDIDNRGVLIDKRKLQKLFKVDGVTEFNILVKEGTNVETLAARIKQKLSQPHSETLEIFTWKDLHPLLLLWETVFNYFIYISYAVVFLVVALGIFFILFISIFERIKEFGILMAVGTPFHSIGRIIVWESIIMGGLGYFFGALGSYGILVLFKRYGLDLSYFSAGLSDIGMAAVMYPAMKFDYFILGFVAVLISSLISVLIPLWKLKHLQAVEAIRFV